MVFVQTSDKFTAYRAFINTLLKDPDIFQETYEICQAIKDSRQLLKKGTGASKSGNMRIGLSIPKTILRALEKYERDNGRRFFTDENDRAKAKKDMHEFMKKFPEFCRPERV